MGRLSRCAIRCVLLVGAFVAPLAAVKAQAIDASAIDAIVSQAMRAFEVPGAAIAIVRGDEVVYLRGFGVKSLGSNDAVTPDTLFAIASTTKAFTTTAMAMLVDEGKMAWDDPVRKHVDFFQLADPLADREVTLRDLVTHRTGVGRHSLLTMVPTDDRAGIIRRIAYLKPSRSFRSAWRYNNLMYMTAGYAVGTTSGSTWDDFVRRRVFEQLGMTQTCFADEIRSRNHARPHLKEEGKIGVMPWSRFDGLNGVPIGPAGSINSTARDLSKWVRFQIGDGTFEGKRLVTTRNMTEMHSPQMVVDFDADGGVWRKTFPLEESGQFTYGLGWFIHDYRGRFEVTHAGVYPGHRAEIALLPKEKLGLVILSNLNKTFMNESLRESLVDHLLGLPVKDWNAYYAVNAHELEAKAKSGKAEQDAQRKKGTKPSLDLKDYTGSYEDPAYGTISVTLENGSLSAQWFKLRFHLEHWHFDSFALREKAAFDGELIGFHLGTDGKVVALSVFGQDFKRKP